MDSIASYLRYPCPHCGYEFFRPEDAHLCAQKGSPVPLPTGLIFQFRHSGKGTLHKVFYAIAAARQPSATRYERSHEYLYDLWVSRDNGQPDLFGDHTLGSALIEPRSERHIPDPKHPAFWRMVEWLDTQRIPVRVWTGQGHEELSADVLRRMNLL